MAKRMLIACRDCKMCTGHAFTGAGRSMGRGLADISTLGVTALARKKCKVCAHPMSEHLGQQAQAVMSAQVYDTTAVAPQTASNPNPARWVLEVDSRYRWWNGEHWTDYYVTSPTPDAAQIEAAKAAVDDYPPRWRQQPDGRFRWWSGSVWMDDYTRDPVGEVEYAKSESTGTSVSAIDDLKKLAELRDAGILTEDEFAAKKAAILARI
jgi:hypothetical protein